jgi:hypothetical protein
MNLYGIIAPKVKLIGRKGGPSGEKQLIPRVVASINQLTNQPVTAEPTLVQIQFI